MTTEQVLNFVDRYGIAVVLLGLAIVWGRQAAIWVGKNVILPLATSHMAFTDSIKNTSETQAKTLSILTESQQASGKKIDEIHSVVTVRRHGVQE